MVNIIFRVILRALEVTMGRTKTYDRKDVLNKAMNLFWKKGFEGTHLQELVSATGLNRFSLYKEFDGKEGIFSLT